MEGVLEGFVEEGVVARGSSVVAALYHVYPVGGRNHDSKIIYSYLNEHVGTDILLK